MHTKPRSPLLAAGIAAAVLAAAGAGAAADPSLTIGVPVHTSHGDPPDWCDYAIVTGQLQGGPVGVTVKLFANAYPFSAAFKDTGLSAATDAQGNYSIKVFPHVRTKYHVVASTTPATTSPDLTERARGCAVIHVSDATPKRGQIVRFYGTYTPAKDGTRMKLLGPGPFGGTLLTGVTLQHNNASSSKFSVKVPVTKSGTYHTEVRADAANELGGGEINLRVHG
jgi:hypothetical protein